MFTPTPALGRQLLLSRSQLRLRLVQVIERGVPLGAKPGRFAPKLRALRERTAGIHSLAGIISPPEDILQA